MKYKPLYLAFLMLGVMWALYFAHFNNGFSTSQGDWGTFGDFTGGILNPFLTFITIYLLITQYNEVRADAQRQREDDAVKVFESSFFTFSTIALEEYKSYEVRIDDKTYKGAEAIGYIQKYVEGCSERGGDVYVEINKLDERLHDSIFSLVSSFCVIFKLIDESCPQKYKEKYINLFSMLLPTKVTYLLCVAEASTKWAMLSYPRNLGYFKKDSVSRVLKHYRKLVEGELIDAVR